MNIVQLLLFFGKFFLQNTVFIGLKNLAILYNATKGNYMEMLNGLNQPVSFYNKNTGNNVNTVINEENTYSSNFFVSDMKLKENAKATNPTKRKRKNKRLNLLDSEYLPDEALDEAIEKDSENNFFKQKENPISKTFKFIFTSIPLINYFYLKNKSKEIKKAVETLNNLSQDVDDLITSPIPYGESKNTYTNIANNLNNVASLINETNKNFQ